MHLLDTDADSEEMAALETRRLSKKAQQKLVIGKIVAFKDGLDEIVDSGVELTVYQIQNQGDKPINRHREAISRLEAAYRVIRGRAYRYLGIPGEACVAPDEPAAIERYVKENWPAVTERMESVPRLDSDFLLALEDERIKAVAWAGQKERDDRLAALLAEGAHAAGDPQQPAAGSATISKKGTKKSTVKGEARAKIIAALTLHHKYADGSCLSLDPIGNNELARRAVVSKSSASDFFNNEFNRGEKGGRAKYRVICRDPGRLADSLKALNGEFSPYDLYGRRPPGEYEREDEE